MIKVFTFDDETEIEKTINDWEQNNKFKIDSISISPQQWYLNNDHSYVTDMKILVIINYHKRRIRKNIQTENNQMQNKS